MGRDVRRGRRHASRRLLGTEVSAFDVHEPHDRLIVSARSLVYTRPYMSRSTLRFARSQPPSPRVRPPQRGSRRSARGSARAFRTRSARRTSRRTRGPPSHWVEVSARTSSTSRSALLRAAGIPARYASGYLHPDVDATIDNAVTGQSHAWLEAWTGSWQRIDPTSGADVAERHVLVARGRDYSDVSPLRGVYNGPPAHSSDVRVTIRRVA